MKGIVEERAMLLGQYIVENQSTVRATAKKFNISKSTVHKDISERLKTINYKLYLDAKKVLEKNKKERHIRGGLATKNKYKLKKQISENK
ncbi:MAG: sporulation transcriptional regulator SpoIIID [Oscillospiraceae bacterium]|nr:sporulation transcriptional regulator SpoIIID [Oscillospiraceae bacterium]